MTLTPNTQITQANVGLLKAGDRVKVSYHGTTWDGIGTVVDIRHHSPSPVGVMRDGVGTGNFSPDCITFVDRPALSPPAEGEMRQTPMHRNPADATVALGIGTPTPAPVDWNVVGPKLVEALERIVSRRQTCASDGVESWELQDIARAALAATQPQSNGE